MNGSELLPVSDFSDALAGLWQKLGDPRLTLALALIVVVLLWWGRGRAARLRALERERHGLRVRGGHVAEALAPLAKPFPVDVGKPGTTTVFLGQPIDYLHFDPDEGISFIEIKSGAARLNDVQRRLRERVDEGSVRWYEMRMPGSDSEQP